MGSPCESNDECRSGKCQNGFCVLKLGREDCDFDIECLSGKCLNGKCTKPSAIQLLDASKTDQFGDDPKSNNFISLFIMVGISLTIILAGGVGGLAVIGSILFFIVSGFFFALIGWLSPFILIGMVVSVLIIFVFFMILKGSAT